MNRNHSGTVDRMLKTAVALCLVAIVAEACSVPVFRYALERWQADPYEVFVFHRGPLTAPQKAQVDRLTREGEAGKTFANVRVTTCDLDNEPDPDLLQLPVPAGLGTFVAEERARVGELDRQRGFERPRDRV